MIRLVNRSLPDEWVLPLSWSKNTPGRAVHLGHDDPLGAVDDEGAVRRHQGHVAHVDVLLLDVLDRARAGLLVDLEHDQAQRHLQRRGIGHVALHALFDVVLRMLELVLHELQRRGLVEVLDREDRLEDALDALAVRGRGPGHPSSGTGRSSTSAPRSGSASPRLRGSCRRTCECACDRNASEPCSYLLSACDASGGERSVGLA